MAKKKQMNFSQIFREKLQQIFNRNIIYELNENHSTCTNLHFSKTFKIGKCPIKTVFFFVKS